MNILLILVVLALAIAAFTYFKASKIENSIRQSSYGDIDIYNILKNSQDFSLLKSLSSETTSFEER